MWKIVRTSGKILATPLCSMKTGPKNLPLLLVYLGWDANPWQGYLPTFCHFDVRVCLYTVAKALLDYVVPQTKTFSNINCIKIIKIKETSFTVTWCNDYFHITQTPKFSKIRARLMKQINFVKPLIHCPKVNLHGCYFRLNWASTSLTNPSPSPITPSPPKTGWKNTPPQGVIRATAAWCLEYMLVVPTVVPRGKIKQRQWYQYIHTKAGKKMITTEKKIIFCFISCFNMQHFSTCKFSTNSYM